MKSAIPAACVLALTACGPGGFMGETDASGESSSSSSSSSTTESGPSDTSEGPDPSTSDTSTTESTTDNFVPDIDMGIDGSCDPFAQDCPDGEKCVPYSSTGGTWDANKCVPVLGDQGVGEPCTYDGTVEATDNCDATSHCWDVIDVDGVPTGTCYAFCMGTPEDPECPPLSVCLIPSNGAINLCIPTCDPVLQDCNEGLACFWANNSFNCIFTTQDWAIGEPCGFINDCAEGLTCIAADVLPACEDAACCSAYCDVERGDEPCAPLPGTSCVPFFEDGTAPPGYMHVGICIVPP